MLGSTGVFWGSMRETVPDEIKLKAPAKKVEKLIDEPAKPAIIPVEYPSIKIRVPEQKNKPLRLNMGERLQAKWV